MPWERNSATSGRTFIGRCCKVMYFNRAAFQSKSSTSVVYPVMSSLARKKSEDLSKWVKIRILQCNMRLQLYRNIFTMLDYRRTLACTRMLWTWCKATIFYSTIVRLASWNWLWIRKLLVLKYQGAVKTSQETRLLPSLVKLSQEKCKRYHSSLNNLNQ